MELEGEKERLQRDEKESNDAETDRTSDEEEEDSEGATLLWQEGYNEDNEGLPIMHWEALSLRIAELEKQEEERREKNAKAAGSPDRAWMEDRGRRAEGWDDGDEACNSHVMALTSRLQTQMNLQLCFINNSESEDEEEADSSKKDSPNNKESAQLQKNPPPPSAKSDKSTKSSKSSKSGKSEKPKSSRGFRNTLRNLRDRLRTDHRTSSSALKDAVVQRRHLERSDLQNLSIKELNKLSTSLRQAIQDLSSELVGLLQIRDQLRTEQDAMLLEVQDLTSI